MGSGGDDLIVEAYVYGELLDAPPTLERVALAFVVDLPPEEVTSLAHPVLPEAVVSLLRFDKYLITWRWRPLAWAVWNHEIIGPVRFWSVKGGADETTLNALSDRRLDSLERSLPKDDEPLSPSFASRGMPPGVISSGSSTHTTTGLAKEPQRVWCVSRRPLVVGDQGIPRFRRSRRQGWTGSVLICRSRARLVRAFLLAGTICVAPVADSEDDDFSVFLVDPIQDPVSASPCAPYAFQLSSERSS